MNQREFASKIRKACSLQQICVLKSEIKKGHMEIFKIKFRNVRSEHRKRLD